MSDPNIKKNVRAFYDRVGWQRIDKDCFQNAQYEDLRPVSRDYIHRCHMRVKRHLAPEGRYLLDAGSGPVQYSEYLTYSEGYHARVCMDISIVALQEARKRLGLHGKYIVADVAHLPFKDEVFDGIVSLHTIHHVPLEDKVPAYEDLYRTLNPGKRMVVVNGWSHSPLMIRLRPLMRVLARVHQWWDKNIKHQQVQNKTDQGSTQTSGVDAGEGVKKRAGTYVQKLDAKWLSEALASKMDYQILVWRSVSVAFLRSVIYPEWGGRFWLKVLFWLEECFPKFFGRVGQYPLLVVRKPPAENQSAQDTSKV